MSAGSRAEPGGFDLAEDAAGSPNPWLIAGVVSLATFMEVLDTTIANVALPYIAGGLAVSADEASWVVTTYLVANAVILTASSFLARMFGRKPFFVVAVALFTASSLLCAFAWNIQSLLLFRVLQGLGGGGMVPVSQSILADAFPPEKRGQGFALFGVALPPCWASPRMGIGSLLQKIHSSPRAGAIAPARRCLKPNSGPRPALQR
jgi:MFS transporter, DHA2 family, multidrug resistance protein